MDASKDNKGGAGGQSDKPAFPKPRPGAFAVTQRVVMGHTAGEHGTFVHDPEPLKVLADTLAIRIHPTEERVNNDPQDHDAFKERTKRMIWLAAASKLAYSMSPEQNASHGGLVRAIRNLEFHVPSAVVPVLDSLGYVKTDSLEFEMQGQPLLSFSYFGKACYEPGDNQALDRDAAFFVNTHWPRWKQTLFDHFKSVVNVWAVAQPHAQFPFGQGNVVTMSVPQFSGGAPTYSQLVQHIPNKPEQVIRALACLVILEPQLPGAGVNQDARNALLAQNVRLVDWNATTMAEQALEYATRVEPRLRTAFSASTNWVPVRAFRDLGSPGQLLYRKAEYMYTAPLIFTGEAMDLGWMFANGHGLTYVNPHACNYVPRETMKQAMIKYVDGMLKHNF